MRYVGKIKGADRICYPILETADKSLSWASWAPARMSSIFSCKFGGRAYQVLQKTAACATHLLELLACPLVHSEAGLLAFTVLELAALQEGLHLLHGGEHLIIRACLGQPVHAGAMLHLARSLSTPWLTRLSTLWNLYSDSLPMQTLSE